MSDLNDETLQQGPPLPAAANENRAMSGAEILEALTYIARGDAPSAALEAALAAPDAVISGLLEELSLAPLDILDRHEAAPSEDVSYCLHELAMHLVACWRDPRGWQLVLDYYVSDCDLAVALSDMGSEAYLPSILTRCYDGSDMRAFERIIETPSFDPLFRQACLQAYHGIVLTGRVPRIRYVSYLARLMAAPAGTAPDEWYGWLAVRAAELQEPSLRPSIDALISRGLALIPEGSDGILPGDEIDAIYRMDEDLIAESILADEHYDDLPGSIAQWSWFAGSPARSRPVTLPWSAAAVFANDDGAAEDPGS